jgi:hypothetical protein
MSTVLGEPHLTTMSLLDTLGGSGTRDEDPKDGPGISTKSAVTTPPAPNPADPEKQDPAVKPAPKPEDATANAEEDEPKAKPKPLAPPGEEEPPVKPKAPAAGAGSGAGAEEKEKATATAKSVDPAETGPGFSASQAYDACTETDKTQCGAALAEWKIALIVGMSVILSRNLMVVWSWVWILLPMAHSSACAVSDGWPAGNLELGSLLFESIPCIA